MKKILNGSLFILLSLVMISLSSCDKETVLTSNQVPEEISNYMEQHFPNNRILQVIKDQDGFTKSYDVILEGGFSLEFNKKKEITEIKGVSKLPDSVIPDRILVYVVENFPSNFIVEWELEDKHQQIELDNGLDIEFTLNGDFIRIDD